MDNDRIIQPQEEKANVNAVILHFFQNCKDEDNHESIMDRRTRLMGDMVVGLMENIG